MRNFNLILSLSLSVTVLPPPARAATHFPQPNCAGAPLTDSEVAQAWVNYLAFVGYNSAALPGSDQYLAPFRTASCFSAPNTWYPIGAYDEVPGLAAVIKSWNVETATTAGFVGSLSGWVISYAVFKGVNGTTGKFSFRAATRAFDIAVTKLIKKGYLRKDRAGKIVDNNQTDQIFNFVSALQENGLIWEAGRDLAEIYVAQRAGLYIGNAATQTAEIIGLALPVGAFGLFDEFIAVL